MSSTQTTIPSAANGSKTLSPPANCQQAELFAGTSGTLSHPTSTDSGKSTTSAALAAGPTRSSSRVGRKMKRFGPSVAHASHLAALEKEWENLTKDTCGRLQETLLATESLQASLENRLRVRLAGPGLEKFGLTWSYWHIGSAPPVCALIASGHRTKGCARVGLPTPQSMDRKGYSEALKHKFRRTGHLKHWTHGTALAVHSRTGKSSWPNPSFVEWMMGFPRAWISGQDYTPTATPSFHNSPRNSSKQQER